MQVTNALDIGSRKKQTMSRQCSILLLGVTGGLSAGLAYSQAVTATLLGTITDASAAVVRNAKVTITEETTGTIRSAQTNESGHFTFPDLPPGRYAAPDTAVVTNLPLGTKRSLQPLLNLVPGTTPAQYQHSLFFNAASSLQTEVNGQERQSNSYQIEGIDDNARTGLLQILLPPAEAIQKGGKP